MKTVWKYNLTESRKISGPIIKFLTVQTQKGEPCVWALVDTDKPNKTFLFNFIGTGFPMVDSFDKYLGSIQMNNGDYVFHIFYAEANNKENKRSL